MTFKSGALGVLGTRGIPNKHGGFETLAEGLLRECTELDVCCDVIGNRDLSISLTLMGRITSHNVFRGLETPLRTWALRRRVCDHDSVLVVNAVNVLTAFWLRRQSKYVLLHMDGMEEQRGKWGSIAKWTHRAARFLAVKSGLTLVTDSRTIQDWYRHKYRKDSVYIPYGGCPVAEEDLSHNWSKENVGDYFLVVARPEPENQIYEVCSAFLSSASPWRLIVVGAPPRPTPYWKRVQRLIGDSQRVHLAGSIYDRDRLCDLYRGCRGVIHGHTVGGTNPSLVDALSHGCPVFVHGNPYNKEVVGDSSPTWNNESDLRQFFSANQTPHSTVDVREFISRYNWADVTQRYLRAFGLK